MIATTNLHYLGDASQGGTYVLRILAAEPLYLSFGRFRGGRQYSMPAGEYVYVGSALGVAGPSSLARRLVRHATRTGDKPPHVIRDEMLAEFPRVGLGADDLRLRREKRLRWNIDHPLDRESVHVAGAYLMRSPLRLEAEVGRLLDCDPATEVIARGLGANDIAGNTHLLRVTDDRLWDRLPEMLQTLLDDHQGD